MQQEPTFPEDILPADLHRAFSAAFPDIRHAAAMVDSSAIGAWLDDPSLVHCWLGEQERIRFSTFRLAKRKREWLAGRICAKRCVLSLNVECGAAAEEISIENRLDGRPFAMLPGQSQQAVTSDISISHSGDYAVALAAEGYCGIDIQQCRDTLLRVTERFCTAGEEALLAPAMPAMSRIARLNCLWSAKEAVRKTLSAMALPDFLQIMFTAVRPGVRQNSLLTFSHHGRSLEVVCTTFDDYAISLCCLKDRSHA